MADSKIYSDLIITTLQSKPALATDVNGKIIEGTGVVEEAPIDGTTYGRKDAAWEEIVTEETDPISLHLDQTTPQNIINGMPIFDGGIRSNDNIILKAYKKFIFDGE